MPDIVDKGLECGERGGVKRHGAVKREWRK
jgi:hypothetical protein